MSSIVSCKVLGSINEISKRIRWLRHSSAAGGAGEAAYRSTPGCLAGLLQGLVRSLGRSLALGRFPLVGFLGRSLCFLSRPAPAVERRQLSGVGHGEQLKLLKSRPQHFLRRLLFHGSVPFLRHCEGQLRFEDVAPLCLIKPDLRRTQGSCA